MGGLNIDWEALSAAGVPEDASYTPPTDNPDAGDTSQVSTEPGYGRTYTSPVDYNNATKTLYDQLPPPHISLVDRITGNFPKIDLYHPVYDIPGLEAAAADRRTQQQLAEMWGGQVPQGAGNSPVYFDPNVELDPSQVTDMRGQTFAGPPTPKKDVQPGGPGGGYGYIDENDNNKKSRGKLPMSGAS